MSGEREQLEARIKKAREERAELDRARAERDELESLRRQAVREENASRDASAIAKAEEDHGSEKIAILETELGSIVVKRPHHLHHRTLANKSGALTTDDLLKYIKPCVVYPDARTLEAWLEELPGVLIPLSDLAFELARGGAREVAKK